MVLVCHMILQDHMTKGAGDFMDRNHPATFDEQWHCAGGGKILVCLVILYEHVAKGSSDFIGRRSAR